MSDRCTHYSRGDHLRLVAITFPNAERCIHCGAVNGLSGARNLRGHWWSVGAIVIDYGFGFNRNSDYLKHYGDAVPAMARVTDAICDGCCKEGRA